MTPVVGGTQQQPGVMLLCRAYAHALCSSLCATHVYVCTSMYQCTYITIILYSEHYQLPIWFNATEEPVTCVM
jgi:hypothetical protein